MFVELLLQFFVDGDQAACFRREFGALIPFAPQQLDVERFFGMLQNAPCLGVRHSHLCCRLVERPRFINEFAQAHDTLPQRRSVFFGVLCFDDEFDFDFEITGIHACSNLVVTIL